MNISFISRIIIFFYFFYFCSLNATEACRYDFSFINDSVYLDEELSDSSINSIKSYDYDFGEGDFLFYYAIAKNYASRGRISQAINSLSKSLEYCLEDNDKIYVLLFRAQLYLKMAGLRRFYNSFAFQDFSKIFSLSKDPKYLIKQAKIKLLDFNIEKSMLLLEKTRDILLEKAKNKVLLSLMPGDYGKDINKEKYLLVRRYSDFSHADFLIAYIYSVFFDDFDKALHFYKEGLDLTDLNLEKLLDVSNIIFFKDKNPFALNNLANILLYKGEESFLKIAYYLAEYAYKTDMNNNIFKDTFLLCNYVLGYKNKADNLYEDIVKNIEFSELKVFSKELYKLMLNSENTKLNEMMVIKFISLVSDPKISIKEIVQQMRVYPNFLRAKVISQEIKLLFEKQELKTSVLQKKLKIKFNMEYTEQFLNKVLKVPDFNSFNNGFKTLTEMSDLLSLRFQFYYPDQIDLELLVDFLTKINIKYGRFFINFFTRKFIMDNGIGYLHVMKKLSEFKLSQKNEIIKRKENLEFLKKSILVKKN